MTTLTSHPELEHRADVDGVPDVTDRCLAGLQTAMNIETGLFDRQIRNKTWSRTLGTEDITSTCICLIGLHRAGIDPATLKISVRGTLESLITRALDDAYVGSIGLVTWATSVWWSELSTDLRERLASHRSRCGKMLSALTTMETAWLVSGLVHAQLNDVVPYDDQLISQVRRELHERVGGNALMMHASRRAGMSHRMRRHVANFADQIYSVQAMSFLARHHKDQQSLDLAASCAERLVDLQGDRGQWWWHYDGRDGTVLQAYPVYSVHQLGMAPMSLLALHASDDRQAWIDATVLSRRWLIDNELGVNMVSNETVWRDQRPRESRLATVRGHARSMLGRNGTHAVQPRGDLVINHETRPYEWAWYLYAEAIAAGTVREGHVV